MDYICAQCGTRQTSLSDKDMQCTKCGYRVFLKERPNIKKELGSD